MNGLVKKNPAIDLASTEHWHQSLPYRAVVPIGTHLNGGTILFQVAGSADAACKAENALSKAMALHGGNCFYCKKTFQKGTPKGVWTIDHIEAKAHGGKSHLGNLVIACKPCNRDKGHQPIDSFNPTASETWLKGLQKQVQQRLDRLKSSNPSK